jgi:hypothetical protein
MDINIIQIILIIVLSGLAWYANDKLNNVPTLKPIVQVLIVVVAVLCLLSSLGIWHNSSHIRISS